VSWLPNVLGFQIVWMASVGGAAHGWWWLGPAALAAFAAMQLKLSRQRRADTILMLGSAVLGFGIDTLWVQAGWLDFRSPLPWPSAAPIWIVAMWMGFALTLNHSLAALKTRPLLAVMLGLLGGPLAYYAAERAWGAVTIAPSPAPYVALAIAWGLLTPALLRAAQHLTGEVSKPAPAAA